MHDFKALFQAELDAHGIRWCTGCDEYNGHRRGFAIRKDRTVHLESQIATRSSLHRALHEVGHIVNDESGMRRFQKEEAANRYAARRMRELGVSIPRKVAASGRRYVARMKRWGDAIRGD